MRVLSLFDGISCGMVALERAGIPVERYVAYEINEPSIKISKKNYPTIEHKGDVTNADFSEYIGFDLLIGGSPCQDLSGLNTVYRQKGKTGLKGEKSRLFYAYVDALNTVAPKYFLFENVASMKAEWRAEITRELGVEPVMINSALVSAQERKRCTGRISRMSHSRLIRELCLTILFFQQKKFPKSIGIVIRNIL